MEDMGLPQGALYENVDPQVYRKYAGISASQSTLFRCMDTLFDLQHNSAYLEEILLHMPKKHTDFLKWLKLTDFSQLRSLAEQHACVDEPMQECLQLLRTFRSTHLNIVTNYTVVQSYKYKGGAEFGLAKRHGQTITAARGAGGSELAKFLKGVRDNTK